MSIGGGGGKEKICVFRSSTIATIFIPLAQHTISGRSGSRSRNTLLCRIIMLRPSLKEKKVNQKIDINQTGLHTDIQLQKKCGH